MNIDKLIKKAIFEKDGPAKEAYRAIKAELSLNNSSKNPRPEGQSLITKTFTFGIEEEPFDITINELDLSIIKSLISTREWQIDMYDANSRKDLADMYREQNKYLKALLPPSISKDKIQEAVVTAYPNGFTQKEMGKVIKKIKAIYPTVDGKLVATVVKEYIV